MNEFVKNKIKWKNKIYKDYVKNGRTENLKLQIAKNDASEIKKYHSVLPCCIITH